jgi:hypothetical protein
MFLAATVLLTSSPACKDLGAQQPYSGAAPDSGSIVRFVFSRDSVRHFGELSRLTADSLILADCRRCSLAYSRGEVSQVEVYRGSNVVSHALLGLLGGAVLGAAVTSGIIDRQKCEGDLCGLRVLAIPYGAIAGAVVGLFVGIRLSNETWESVP